MPTDAVELNIAAACEAVAATRPNQPALVTARGSWNWAQVQDRTRRLAAVLVDHGLGRPGTTGDPRWSSPHDHVALYLLNGNEYLEGMLGAWKARCAPFNVNYRYVADELRYLLDDADARAVVVHARFAPVLAEVLGELARPPVLVLQVDDGSGEPLLPGALDYETALAQADPHLEPELVESWSGDDLYLCYTGGTTGMPKGTMWRQADFVVAALGVRRRDGGEYRAMDELVADAHGRVVALPAPPLMHGAAHWNALSCWLAGGTVVIQSVVDRFDPADVVASVERHGATSLLLVGDPMTRPLVDLLRGDRDRVEGRRMPTLRHLLSGGAVLSPGTKAELMALLPGVTIVDVLGSTESGRQAVARSSADSPSEATFVPSSTTTVLDEALTRRLSPREDELGWLAQTGRVPLGYLGDPERSARTFPVIDGIRHAVPGDRARLRSDGRIELLGRDSVCINTGGEKVFAEEVETAVKAHPGVLDAVVCGRPSTRWGEEVVAVVALRPGAEVSDEELRDAAGADLARYKLPRAFLRVDNVERSPSGKADYRWAREQAMRHARG